MQRPLGGTEWDTADNEWPMAWKIMIITDEDKDYTGGDDDDDDDDDDDELLSLKPQRGLS